MMTTLHRKPRGASELGSSSASNGGASSATSYYTTIDILPSSSARDAAGVHNTSVNSSSHQSSKTRRHGGGKYVRRSGFFGRGNGSPSSTSSASSSSSTASKKMSTTQLRAFFAACVLVYLSALCFAEDIVAFGKAVNSDATRQKIFSQWRPVHSAAKQVLRSIVDTANGNGDSTVVIVNATESLSEPETAASKPTATKKEKKEKSGSPEPSINSEREPPTAAVLTAAPPAVEQVAPPSYEVHLALLREEPSVESNTGANRPAAVQEQEKRLDPLPHVDEVNDKQPLPDAAPAAETKEKVPQHLPVIADIDRFDPAQMKDRMEDSAVVDELKDATKSVEDGNDVQPEQKHWSSAARVDDAVENHELPKSTPVAAFPAEATAAVDAVVVAEVPTTAEDKDKVPAAADNAASTPPSENHVDLAETQASASQAPSEEPQAKVVEENAVKTEEPTPESRHPGREET